MQKSKGRVRNFVVNDVGLFTDLFARILCRSDVSYVQVNNEFHCFDKIYRFYSLNEYKELCGIINFVGMDGDLVRVIEPFNVVAVRDAEELNRELASFDESDAVSSYQIGDDVKGVTYTKQKRQHDNRCCKDKLRRSIGNTGRINNHHRHDL